MSDMVLATSTDKPFLTVDGLKKYFPVRRGLLQRITGWTRAVEDVSFKIGAGRTLGLVGESGCGKTTVARMILKLLDADEGHIFFRGQDLTLLNEKQMRPLRKEIQIIFQDPYGSLNPRMTVAQTLSEGLRFAGYDDRGERRRNRMQEVLETAGLSSAVLDRYPHEFSGGQRQRIGIARALSVEPSLIICDEPISALDVSIQAQIINLLKDLQEQLGLSYLFISHDLNVVGYISDHVAVMYRGQVVEYGPSETLFENPRHPYTDILLAAVPDPDEEKKVTAQATGTERSGNGPPPEGCRLLGRCPIEEPHCENGANELLQVGPKHYVRCWKAKDRR
jgi:oligopeptide/dipeptide ABC transporter ATP-binding protein